LKKVKKSLPEIRKSEARASELFYDPNELTKELLSPVGEGKYAIVKHQNHAEFTYIY
jgi:hypothetical protein